MCTDFLCTCVDVIMLGAASDLVCESCCNRFFAVAHDLEYGFVMEGHVDPGDYKLKVQYWTGMIISSVTQMYTFALGL